MVLPDALIPWLVERGAFPVGEDAEVEVAEYWQHMSNMGIPFRGATSRHIPLWLWGDDAQFTETTQDKLVTISFGRVLETGTNALLVCWPICVYQHVPLAKW